MAGCQRLEYVPPPVPPQPLPPPPIDLAVAGPDLAAGYRPTLQSPPPPLLDGQSPPPLAVGWTARQPEPWTGAAGLPTPPPVVDQPGIYIVRDGDDLTGIATRFYGHPAAAAAIWQANRGLLRDPGILPIGAALVLPPRAAVAALGRPTDQALIEPAIAGQQAGSAQGNAVSRPASWLTDR
jgi:phage tail protein X